MYTLLIAVIYLAFISLGLPDSLLGSAWPVMHGDIGVPVSYMGILSMVISGFTIISSLFSDKITHRFGTRYVVLGSVFLTAVALFGFSASRSFTALIILSVPYGLGAGAIDSSLNNYVAQHYSSKYMSWLHCFWGVGALISPFVMGWALTHSVWNAGYRIIGFVQLGIALLLTATLPLWKINEATEVEKAESVSILSALKIRGVPCIIIGFFAYCSAEATSMYWASTYFAEVRGIAPERAALFASLFYIGITAGRFISGFIANKLGDRRMIIAGTCFLTCGVLSLFIPSANEYVLLIGFIIIGFGCAPIYPSIIHSTPENFGKENSGAIIGIQMASAYAGTTLMPPVYGFIGRSLGYGIMPVFLLAYIALMITMTEMTFRITAKKK